MSLSAPLPSLNLSLLVPSLGLHSAAATGNLGLVEYALARGQPINSVLDGVLPLHAAAAGGNERVVNLLIERGADVNAPRLPRRYSDDKNRDTSAPIVGTSGSTPLHFAAANGKTNIVTTLLLRGAHASRADKHGITPEMLARQNGWEECADVLKEWILNKDRDLRERQGPAETDEPARVPLSRFASRDASSPLGDGETSTRRRIQMKRSMDTALGMLKGASPSTADAVKPPLPSSSTSNVPAHTSTLTPPASPMRPFGEYTFYSYSPGPIDPNTRRPSLPQTSYPVPPAVNRKTSLATRANPRRPRSAGTDAEREVEIPTSGRGGAGRKLGSKHSLLNIFKKGQTEENDGVPLERSGTQSSTSVVPSASARSSSSSVPSADSSPGPLSINLTEPTFIVDDDEDEYAYGRPLPNSRLGVVVNTKTPVLLSDRGLSFTSLSLSSLSPVLSTPRLQTDFPFSINQPPPIPFEGTSPRDPSSLDNRGRGDSVSNTSTTDSQINPQMSASGSGSVTVTTPLQMLAEGSSMALQEQFDGEDIVQVESERSAKSPANRLNERRSHMPLDISLSLISSNAQAAHAQAEALVQKELQDILEMPAVSADNKGAGWTPLSARLAAYGESLERERKFRTEVSPVDKIPTAARPQPAASTQRPAGPRHNGVDRQSSLDAKPDYAPGAVEDLEALEKRSMDTALSMLPVASPAAVDAVKPPLPSSTIPRIVGSKGANVAHETDSTSSLTLAEIGAPELTRNQTEHERTNSHNPVKVNAGYSFPVYDAASVATSVIYWPENSSRELKGKGCEM
ncbi:hypothetical protein FB451DRAFT_1017209 [Mycena latifolia]|nr:hypothetical protein FB451DRAFT_1017209 [Mycena latifolia]